MASSYVSGPSSPRISLRVSGVAVIAGPRSLMRSDFLRGTGGGRSTAGGSVEK